ASLSANIGASLLHVAESLTAGLTGGLSSLLHTAGGLTGNLGAALSGLTQTGDTIARIWVNTTEAVAVQLGGALSASLGVGLPGLLGSGETLTAGIDGATTGLVKTGEGVVTSLDTALRDLELSLRANFSFGFAA
ncbi:MAG: hypothetical protein WBZ37_10745, partial [Mycobacterium sp.]